MIVFFEEKPTSSGYNEISLGKCPKEHMFWIFMRSYLIFVFIYVYDLSLERSKGELQLCNWKHINQNSYTKVVIKQIFKHICSSSDMVAHWSNLSSFSLGKIIVLQGKNKLSCLKLLLPKDMIVPQEEANFLKEQWTSPEERPKFLAKTYVFEI
jgi:hypothetical protein